MNDPCFFRFLCLQAVLALSALAQDPVLRTPGTGSFVTETTATGTRTVFTLSDNSVYDWAHLDLDAGSELVFDFTGGGSVINVLGGSAPNRINGSVNSNGIVAFFSPGGDLEVNGQITARGVVLGTANVDPGDFFGGNGYLLSGSTGLNLLTVDGRVTATGGDVVIAGSMVIVGDSARLDAGSGRVGIGGSSEVSVSPGSEGLLRENGGSGFVLTLGETRAARIDVVAGNEISNQGMLNAGNGRVFLEVGGDGIITNESSGIIVGNLVTVGSYREGGAVFRPNEGDALPVVSEGMLSMPALKRPDGTQVSGSRSVRSSSAVSASEDAARPSAAAAAAVRESSADGKTPLVRRASFFGMRGGDPKAVKR